MSSHDPSALPHPHTDINILPMIDILLVLIIIFMLQRTLVIRFEVPPPATLESAGQPAGIVLTLDSTGACAINRSPVPAESLGVTLEELFADRPRKVLLIQPDRARPWREVIRAMDTARGAGVEVLSPMPHHP